MHFAVKHFQELTLDEFHDIIALRLAVFVVEQDCPYQDLDELDKDAYHLIVRESNTLIGTARILKPGVVYKEVAIGRVVSQTNHRDKKVGHFIMEKAMAFIQQQLRQEKVRLSAQTHLIRFYKKHGFRSTGKAYLEDGIPHTEMLYEID